MGKILVIVESPAKCKKIESYLGPGYKCVASFGHIRELSKGKGLSSIDINNNYKPSFNISSHQYKNVNSLRELIQKSDDVLLATDDDREGEAIAWHICQVFNLPVSSTKRIIFHEITESALQNAVRRPTTIDLHKVNSQIARQVLDYLVGFSISPVLWKYISSNNKSSLSAGRCQTPALRLVYDNYNNIKNNPGKECYNITGYFTKMNFPFTLSNTFESKENVEEFLEETVNHSHIFTKSTPEQVTRKPPEPFTTSTLQQKASSILHYSPKETMRLCQVLYEEGFITYMRTDSKVYSKEFINSSKTYIQNSYGEKYINENIDKLILEKDNTTKPTTKTTKTKKDEVKAQEAHEAIRPTNILTKPSDIMKIADSDETNSSKLTVREFKMYKLIWENSIKSCMSDAIFNVLVCYISAPDNNKYKYSEEQVVFNGWTIIDNISLVNPNYEYLRKLKSEQKLSYNKVKADYTLKETKQHYTEAKLVSLLEKQGIGRPSTFSSLITKIQERGYVKVGDVEGRKVDCVEYELCDDTIEEKPTKKQLGNESKKMILEPLGLMVIEFLIKHFPDIFSYDYTKHMEDDLDNIATNKKVWYNLCDECYKSINVNLESIKENKVEKEVYKIDDTYTYKMAKYGAVLVSKGEDGKNVFHKIKSNITIDLEDIKKGLLKAEDLIETQEEKQANIDKDIVGYIEEKPVFVKKGNYGLYASYNGKNYSLKSLKKAKAKITLEDVRELINESKDTGVLRQVNEFFSIRNGNYGHYIFYKTPKMKKPQFFQLKKCDLDYLNCSNDDLIEWIRTNCKI